MFIEMTEIFTDFLINAVSRYEEKSLKVKDIRESFYCA